MTNIKRVGIIGFGMIGKVHAYGYATLPYYLQPMPFPVRLTHIATAHADTAEHAKTMTGADVATTDFREITENPDIDIVHICTPNDQHLAPLLSAMRHNKHIYCDKPLVANIDEAEQVREAMEEYRGVSQMTFHLRFFPAVQRAKQLIDAGKLGRILQFRMGYYHASNAGTEFPYKWKHSPSGGVIRDLGSHVIDMVDHLFGPIDRLIADTTIAYPQRRDPKSCEMREIFVEDAFSILVRLKNGATGTLEGTKLATGYEDDFRFEIHGELGAVRFSLAKADILEFFDATKSDKPFGGESGWLQIACCSRFETPDTDFPAKKSTIGWIRAHTACLAHLIQAIDACEQNPSRHPEVGGHLLGSCLPQHADLMQGYKIEQLMQSVFDSAQKQTWCLCLYG